MNADVIALRAHLVAEVEQAKREADKARKRADTSTEHYRKGHPGDWRRDMLADATTARTATDAWLAADARLRALDGLIAASKAQHDAYELQSTGTFARGRWYTREEIDALMLAPCEGDACAWRECLPCGLRRLGPR